MITPSEALKIIEKERPSVLFATKVKLAEEAFDQHIKRNWDGESPLDITSIMLDLEFKVRQALIAKCDTSGWKFTTWNSIVHHGH